jgi:transcriptional regulator with XRE-family HTH domain
MAIAEVQENQGERFTVEELSERTGLSTSTFSRLWTSKSGVDRRTLRLLFSAFQLELQDSDIQQELEPPLPDLSPPVDPIPASLSPPMKYPSGPVPLNSRCYIQRPGIDDRALQEITQPGCVVRIKAPSGFGKTSLVSRMLHYAEHLGYATVQIDLQQAETTTLGQTSSFLRWFCLALSRKLGLESKLEDYWDQLSGSKLSTTIYLQDYILTQVNRPLVLAINELNCLFEHPETAQNVLPLLRSWHEEAQQDELWQRLRLVVAYSTDTYLPLDINQSPFNVGLPLLLPEFTADQVEALASAFCQNWEASPGWKFAPEDIHRLLTLIGGNPLLVNIALYYLCNGMSLDELLQSACTPDGIYRSYLQRLFSQINQNPQWVNILENLTTSGSVGISLDPLLAYKLEGMGLIQPTVDGWRFRCELYRRYFQTYPFLTDS